MDNEIMVSILCATYNHKSYIAEALDSFIMQKTNFKFEVIINDDASTDGTADIIREYEQKYPDIIKPIYQTENQYSKGVKITREINLPRAKGKYVAFCEGDDYWTDENKLQMQVDFLEKNPEYVMCSHAHRTVYEDKSKSDRIYRFNNESCDVSFVDCLEVFSYLHTATLMLKNETICKFIYCFPNFPYFSDYVLRIASAYYGKAHYIDKVMSVYRRNVPGSYTIRIEFVKEKNIEKNRKLVFEYYDDVDKFTEYKYHKEIQSYKYRQAFNCDLTKDDYKKLKKSDNFKVISSKDKIKYYIGSTSTTLINALLKKKSNSVITQKQKWNGIVKELFFKKTKKED